jgi:hypothetical protein
MLSAVRVFLPLTTADLALLHATGWLPPRPGHAGTDLLRDQAPDEDQDDRDYRAMTFAAADSLRLLAADPTGRPRRVVLAADVAVEDLTGPRERSDPTRVELSAPVRLAQVAAVHVDDPAAADAVRAAAAALDPAALDEHELQWYATQEIPDLL